VEKKKILMISQYFSPDITAAAYRMESIYQILKYKYNVTVLTTTPHKSAREINEVDNNIHRVNIKSKKNSLQYIEFLIKGRKIIKKLKKEHVDFVFVSSPPIFVFYLSKYLDNNVKMITDIRDLWPDSIVEAGKIKKTSPIYKMLSNYERKIYEKSYYITCVSRYMKKEIFNRSGKLPVVVYNGFYEKDFFTYEKKHPSIWDGERKLKICYFGNVGFAQFLEPLLEISDDREMKNKVDISIIGNGNLLNTYKNKYSNVNYIEPLDRYELLEYVFNNYDVLFLNLKESEVFEKTIPSKLFDYLLLKKPIISGIKGEGKEILNSFGNAIHFESNSTESLKEAINEVMGNYDFYLNNIVKNYSKLIEYSRENNNKKILDIIEGKYEPEKQI